MDYTVLRETSFVLREKSGDIFAGINMKPAESHITLTLRREANREEYKLNIEKLFDEEGNLLQTSALSTFEGHLASFSKLDKKKD